MPAGRPGAATDRPGRAGRIVAGGVTVPALAPYPAPEERERALARRAAALGGEVRVLGTSVEERPIRAARIPRRGSGDARVLVCAGIHGVELVGSLVALEVLRALEEGDAAWERVRDRAEVWVLPSLNPDAYARTWARGGVGRLAELRVNARGVDLNRNYPLPAPQRPVWVTLGGWRTGSSDPENAFYRGPEPLSEPETAALAALCAEVPFRASANLHSTMGTVIPPHVTDAASDAAYRRLVGALRRGQRRAKYKRLASRRLDLFMGEQEDYQHHVHGTWAVCVEHYPIWVDAGRFLRPGPLVWRFNPRRPEPWLENDVPGLASYFEAALELG